MSVEKLIESRMLENEFIFNPAKHDLEYLKEMTNHGKIPVCCRCGSRLKYALTPKQVKDSGNAPGVLCPSNPNHCQIAINLSGFWDLYDKIITDINKK